MDTAARGARRAAARVDRIADLVGLLDVAGETIDDRTGDPAMARSARENAAPAGRVDAGELLDHDDVIGAAGLDRRGGEMAGHAGRRWTNPDLHRDGTPGDRPFAAGEHEPGHGWRHAKRIDCVGDIADIERAQAGNKRIVGHMQFLPVSRGFTRADQPAQATRQQRGFVDRYGKRRQSVLDRRDDRRRCRDGATLASPLGAERIVWTG